MGLSICGNITDNRFDLVTEVDLCSTQRFEHNRWPVYGKDMEASVCFVSNFEAVWKLGSINHSIAARCLIRAKVDFEMESSSV